MVPFGVPSKLPSIGRNGMDTEHIERETTKVLTASQELLGRFVVFPSPEARDAAVLWAAATWISGYVETFGRIYFQSAEYGSGKTVAMEKVSLLTRKVMWAVNATPAIVYRSIDNSPPTQPITVCVDEADMLFGAHGSSSAKVELLGLLNAGYKRSATVPRARGQNEVHEFRAYAPVALAGKGKLPDALMTRSIVVRMKKATKEQLHKIDPFRERFHAPLFEGVSKALENWSGLVSEKVQVHIPEMPKDIVGRDAEVWEPLITVADLAGGEWAQRARDAARFIVDQSKEEVLSPTKKLVKVARDVFATCEGITPARLAREIGDGWTSRDVTATMREIGVFKVSIRENGKPTKGFKRELFEAATELV